MNQKALYPVITLLVGAAGGFFVGKGNPAEVNAADVATESAAAARTSRSGDSGSSKSNAKNTPRKPRSTQDILQTPGQLARMQALLDFYSSLSPEQLAEESKKLDAVPMPERIMASYVLFAKWAETDPFSAMEHSGKMGFAGMFVKPTIMQSWASVDANGAAAYYNTNKGEFSAMSMFGGGRGGGPMGNGGASIIAGEWARQDPDAAMTWAKSLTGNESGNALSSIITQVATTDPKKAITLAASLEGDQKKRANNQIAESLGGKDWSEAKTFIAGLPADQQAEARERAFDGLSRDNPLQAMNELSNITDEKERKNATNMVAEELSKVEPQKAFDLVISSASDDEDAMRNVMMNYSRQDRAGALAAINKVPEGEMRDTAIGTYVFSNTGTEYAQNVTLAESITDQGSRDRAVGVSISRWMSTDPEAAKQRVKESTVISDEMKQRIEQGNIWGGRGGSGRSGR
jgi:hypothetical protein